MNQCSGRPRLNWRPWQLSPDYSTGQHRTKCNSVSCATLHNGQIRSLSVCPLYMYMYTNYWNTQSKPCHYELQMPINIHLQIRFRIMNNAKCPINIKSISSLNWECHFCHRQTSNLSRKTCKNWFISSTPWFSHTKPNPYWYNEHLRPKLFYLAHLIPAASYKLCLVIWTPPFSLILTNNVCILLQSSQIMDTCLFHHRQGHLAFASQHLKTFSAQVNLLFCNEHLLSQHAIAPHHRQPCVALENQAISQIIQNYSYSRFAISA